MRTLVEILVTMLLTIVIVVGVSAVLAREEAPQVPTAGPTQQAAAAPQTTAAPETTVGPETTAATTAAPVEMEPEKAAYDTVPRYYQTDYPYDPFGNGTISTSGCSVTCLAMAATYLTDQEYMPDELAYHFKGHGKNNIERLEFGNEQLQLPNVRTDNVQEVLDALKAGKIVIAMMDDESVFTTTQHFILLAGMTAEGKILVNDPLEKTHEGDIYMETGYAEGFGDFDIRRGFSGAWIYDKAAMPEDPFLFDATMPEEKENRYSGYQLVGNDTYILASFLWVEARDETEEVQQAIAEVLLNRVASEGFPNTVHNVIYQSELYDRTEKMQSAQVDLPQYRAVTAAVEGPYVLPEDVYYFSRWETKGDIWGKLGAYTFLHSRG